MIWFFTLVGFWLAFFAGGLICSVVAILVLARINERLFGCVPFFLLTFVSYAVLFGITYFFVPQGYWNPSYDPQKLKLDEFVREMSPSLFQKIEQLNQRQSETAEKIKKLTTLRKEHPNFAEQVGVEIAKWEDLAAKIDKTLKRIGEQTEAAFVEYQIDEIAGRDRFSHMSSGLQDEAIRVLDLARVLYESVEKNSPRKEGAPDEIKSLDDLLEEIK